jgi:hypothetical protein
VSLLQHKRKKLMQKNNLLPDNCVVFLRGSRSGKHRKQLKLPKAKSVKKRKPLERQPNTVIDMQSDESTPIDNTNRLL